jgi:arginyl-tRNA synthetase
VAGSFAPNILCNYLFDLAKKFNLFYQKHKILSPVILNKVKNPSQTKEILRSAQDDNTQEFRLALTMAVGQIIKNGLYLLGIRAPERM